MDLRSVEIHELAATSNNFNLTTMKLNIQILVKVLLLFIALSSICIFPFLNVEKYNYQKGIIWYFLIPSIVTFTIVQYLSFIKTVNPTLKNFAFWCGVSSICTIFWGFIMLIFSEIDYALLIMMPFFLISGYITLLMYRMYRSYKFR